MPRAAKFLRRRIVWGNDRSGGDRPMLAIVGSLAAANGIGTMPANRRGWSGVRRVALRCEDFGKIFRTTIDVALEI